MEEEKKKKGFFQEFKEFICRGNIMDMAVGVIVGSAFTAIVTALSNGILKPIINWIIALCVGGDTDALASAYTILKPGYVVDENGVATDVIDLSKSIYIDWGGFISAIINFLLVALVLFLIVKAYNKARNMQDEFVNAQKQKLEAKKQEQLLKEQAIKEELKNAEDSTPSSTE